MRSYTEQFIDSLVDLDNFSYYLEEGLNPELLDREEARAIWHYVREYYEGSLRRSVPSLEILEEEFPKWRFAEPQAEPHWILGKLKEQWEFRESRNLIHDLSKMSPEDVFPFVKERIWEAEQVLDTERNVMGIDDFVEQLDQYFASWRAGDLMGATTGFEEIDVEMGGIRAKQLAIIGARLKTGKTWFGLKAFLGQRMQRLDPIFVTLELSPEEIRNRIYALWTGLSYNAIDKGYLTPEEMDFLKRVVHREVESGLPLWVVQPPAGQRKVSDMVALVDKYKGGSLIIDQLNWIEASKADRDYFRDDLRIGDITKELKIAAQTRNIPIYVMHQFNRQQKPDEELQSMNYGDSDKIGQIADHLFGIAKTKELRDAKQIRFEIMDSRSSREGGVFTCDFEFYERTNMGTAVRGELLGEMTVQDAMLLGSGSQET